MLIVPRARAERDKSRRAADVLGRLARGQRGYVSVQSIIEFVPVDTDVLVRLVARDEAKQVAAAEAFAARGAWVPHLVLAETAWDSHPSTIAARKRPPPLSRCSSTTSS
jgi:predicted nucleic-acid-binding protein